MPVTANAPMSELAQLLETVAANGAHRTANHQRRADYQARVCRALARIESTSIALQEFTARTASAPKDEHLELLESVAQQLGQAIASLEGGGR